MVLQNWEQTTPKNKQPAIVLRLLPDGVAGYYCSETDTVYIDPRLSPGQRRATVEHELYHAERHDSPTGDPLLDIKQENHVETVTAYRLITVEALEDAARWCQSTWEMAEYLEVDEQLLGLRIKLLTNRERKRLKKICMGWWCT